MYKFSFNHNARRLTLHRESCGTSGKRFTPVDSKDNFRAQAEQRRLKTRECRICKP